MRSSRRREKERQIRKKEILNAAREVFTAKGFLGATMEEIAEKADYSQATLYLYFKNKYELYTSLSYDVLNRFSERFEELASLDELSPAEKIRRTADVMLEVYEYDSAMLVNLFRLQSSQGLKDMTPEMVEKLNGVAGRIIRVMAKIFQKGVDDGIFREFNAIALADSIWAIFTGMVLWEESKRFFDPKKEFLKPTLDAAIQLFLDGLLKEPEKTA